MESNGELAQAVQAPVSVAVAAPAVEIKSNKPIMVILVVVGVVLLLLGAVGLGVWNLVNNGKKEVKTLAQKQTEQLAGLEQNLNQVVSLYKNSDSSGTGNNTNAVVLGDSIARDEGDRVLGLEDNPAVVKERALMSKLDDGRAAIGEIRKIDAEVKSRNSGLVTMFLPKENPVEKTEEFLTNYDRIYAYFQKSADRDVRSTALGFNLGVALQMAIATPDEPSIQRLENVINDFQNMVKEEKNTDVSQLPETLVTFHQKIVAADKELVDGVANLPTLFRQKDLQGIKDNLKTFLTNAVMAGTTGQVDLVSFWQGDATVRLLPGVTKDWQDYSNKL
jgi:hypothetical protein